MHALRFSGNFGAFFSARIESQANRGRASREDCFAEGPLQRARRALRATARLARRDGLVGLLRHFDLILRDRCIGARSMPDPAHALAGPEGLCGGGVDLAPAALAEAYARGLHVIMPAGPAAYCAPAMRLVARAGDFAERCVAHPAPLDIVCDQRCDAVIAACQREAAGASPLSASHPALSRAHARLVDLGLAHCYRLRGGAAGGYGIAVGRTFVMLGVHGATMAERAGAFAAFDQALAARGFRRLDLTFVAARLPRSAAQPMPRREYTARLAAEAASGPAA